jgi:hypothetical protein
MADAGVQKPPFVFEASFNKQMAASGESTFGSAAVAWVAVAFHADFDRLALFGGGNEQHVIAARFALGFGRAFAGFEFVFAHALGLVQWRWQWLRLFRQGL